jgi:hypothetical protein
MTCNSPVWKISPFEPILGGASGVIAYQEWLVGCTINVEENGQRYAIYSRRRTGNEDHGTSYK